MEKPPDKPENNLPKVKKRESDDSDNDSIRNRTERSKPKNETSETDESEESKPKQISPEKESDYGNDEAAKTVRLKSLSDDKNIPAPDSLARRIESIKLTEESPQNEITIPPVAPLALSPVIAPTIDPSIIKPSTSKSRGPPIKAKSINALVKVKGEDEEPCHQQFAKFLYNKEDDTYCGRDCESWLHIIAYSLIYLMFLCTYTMIWLYISLRIVKATTNYFPHGKPNIQEYTQNGIELTATPMSELGYPLIWYRNGELLDHKRYVDVIDDLLQKASKKGANISCLGPCAKPPYGYGDKPCVIIKINKLINWVAKPLDSELAAVRNAPEEVKNWIKIKSNMLWLHCSGYHSYDKEHIQSIKYYPDPPGLDANFESQIVAVQIFRYTMGLSLAVECKLWYENGHSTVEFMLYVSPQSNKYSIGLNNSDLHFYR